MRENEPADNPAAQSRKIGAGVVEDRPDGEALQKRAARNVSRELLD